jgi:hypothetical protein
MGKRWQNGQASSARELVSPTKKKPDKEVVMENPFNHRLVVSRQQIQGLFLAVILAGGIAGSAQAQVTASVSGIVARGILHFDRL